MFQNNIFKIGFTIIFTKSNNIKDKLSSMRHPIVEIEN